jgi:WD40 repeat protein/DNA-binding SARP family transcriptional activator
MQIRVLGSVDVEMHGRSLKLAGPKQRGILSMLALGANTPVSLERLIDGLWGEEPPATAPKMVQQYVSQLRRLLADGDGPAIVTRGGGYELQVDPAAVDALHFEQLVERAGADNGARRTDLAREALALWRGPPLAGLLEEPFAASEARRLEELHLAAIELTIEGDLGAGRHADVIGRLGALVDEHPLRERLRGLLMLALYRAGRQAEALDLFRDARWTLVETLGLEPGPELRRLQEAILRQDPALELVVPDAAWAGRETAQQVGVGAGRASRGRAELRAVERELAANVIDLQTLRADRRPPASGHEAVCPFKGLESFDEGDAEYFFGRERLVAEIVASLPGAALLGAVGPSGSGKSSAVRAGLLPALAAGVLPGSERWTRVVLRPGEQPMPALRRALHVPGDAADPLAHALERLEPDGRLLLVVDQFEEVFAACQDETQRAAFLDVVVDAAESREGAFVAVLALRADFYGACAAHPRLAHLLGRNQVLVGPMRPDELARAIEGPAARAGLTVEPELVARLVEDTAGRAGGLPLLSTALLELWRQRAGRRMTAQTYERTGGVQGAVARLAETAYASLGPEETAVARNILLRLAGAGEPDAVVRRRVPLAELDLAHSDPARRVLTVLTDNRLLTVGGDTVEVAHEALLREWPRLRRWLEQDAEARRLHRHLTLAARDWETDGRDPGELYRGTRLASALEFASGRPDALNQLEREFLDEARLVTEREALRSRRMNRRLRVLLAGALVALAVAATAGIVALDQRTDARDAAVVADAQRLGAQALTDDRLDRALLLARAGVELDDSVATRGNLLATLQRVPPASLGVLPDVRDIEIYALAVSPRGDRLAVGDAFGEVRVFETATRRRVGHYRLRSGLVQRLAFSPDGATLAVAAQEPVDQPPGALVDLLDARSMQRRARVVLPPLPEGGISGASPVFAANGRDLVVLQVPLAKPQPQVVRRIDGRTGRAVGRPFRFSGVALDPAVSGDGRRVLVTSASEDATYELDTADLRVIARHRAGGVAVALDADGRTLAVAGEDGKIRLLHLRSSRIRRLAGRHRASVVRMSFTPDGRTLASSDEDGKLILWDTATQALRERLDAHTASVEALAITPDGRTAISAGIDGRVALSDVTRTRRLIRSVPLRGSFDVEDFTPRGVAVSPDDRTLAVTEADGAVDLIDTATLERRASVGGGGAALAVDFSPDGRLLAVSGDHGRVRLWDARTRRVVGRLHGLRAWSQAIAFSPDGRLLAGSEVDTDRPRLRIWDVRRRTLTAFRAELGANALAFSPDGRLIAGAGGAQGTEVRDVRTSRLVAHPTAGELARSVAFSPDGRLLFVGLWNGAGQFFSTRDWRAVGAPIRGQGQRLLSPRFTPDGRTLATSSADGTVLLWDVASRKPIGSPLLVERESFVAAAISRDGAHLYALPTGTDGIRLTLSPDAWKRHACTIAGRELSRREWEDALPSRPYRPVCGRQ